MKWVLVLLSTAFFSGHTLHTGDTSQKINYCYCLSRPKQAQGKDKATILISPLKEIPGDEKELNEKAHEWGLLVSRSCTNTGGCTSDLNAYPSREEGAKHFETSKINFSDTSRYILKEIDF